MNKDYYTAHLKSLIEERSKPFDTTQVQLDSVKLFMEQLGYRLHHPQKDEPCLWRGYIRRSDCSDEVQLPKCISFRDACALHNGQYYWVDEGSDYQDINVGKVQITCSSEKYLAACQSVLVEKVYLQRKGKGVKCQQHWVKFAE